MKSRVEQLLHQHFENEVEEVRGRLQDGQQKLHHEVEHGRLRRSTGRMAAVAAAALLLPLPGLLYVSGSLPNPLSEVIDVRWDNGGRAAVSRALHGVVSALSEFSGQEE